MWSTLIAGNNDEGGTSIALDKLGNVYITGYTFSSDYPVSDKSFLSGGDDIILTAFNPEGRIFWSTLIGASNRDIGTSIAFDKGGNLYISGYTYSYDFSVSDGSKLLGNKDYFIVKMNIGSNPIILNTEVENREGIVPLNVELSCDAYDPDGGDIVKYIWNIAGSDFSDKIVTYTGMCPYVFVKPGTYNVSITVIDEDGETSTSTIKDNFLNDVSITVTKPDNYDVVVPLTVAASGKTKGINITNSLTSVLNISDEEVNLTVKYYDSNGDNAKTNSYTIEPKGKFTYDPATYNTDNYPYAVLQADNYVLADTKVITDSGQMTSYLLPMFGNKLYIPHIAEETDYWETEMYVSALQPTNLNVKVNTEESQYTIPQFSTSINLEDLLGANVEEAKTWGMVESEGTQSLSGFEIFQHNGTDGAGVELQSSVSTTLFIPHIPEETHIFWTGFAIVNPNNEDANLTVDLYTSEGEKVSTVNLTIPAQSKLKGLAGDLFGEAYGNAEWGIIRSDKPVFGIEIYGTVADGICGYSLPSIATTEGYLPELISGENYWNGIAITNPSNEEATVTISLMSSDGTVKATKDIQLGSMERFKSVVKNFFEGVDIESTDYIYYHSTTSVIAIEVSGDLDRTFMFSLIGKE